MTKLCKHGHEMTLQNTYVNPKSKQDVCRKCRMISAKKSRENDKRALQRAKDMVGV